MSKTSVGRAAFRSLLLILAFTLAAYPAIGAESESSLRISGCVSNASDWTNARLKEQFAAELKEIHYMSKGQPHTSTCVALLSVLKAAGLETDLKMNPAADPKTKNMPLRIAVVVQGNDGYTVIFSLPELLPQIVGKDAWLALDVDGAPLADGDSPAKLIVPQDQKPGRWVHGISAITLVDMSSIVAATQPSTQP